jgi:hypothetical protein
VGISMSVSYTTASAFSLREGKVAILDHLIPSVGSCGHVKKCMPSYLRFRIAIKLSSGKTSPVIDDRLQIPGGQQFPLHPKHLRI